MKKVKRSVKIVIAVALVIVLLLSAPKYRGVQIKQMTVPISGSYGGMRGLGGRSLFSVDFDTNAKALREFIYGVTAE